MSRRRDQSIGQRCELRLLEGVTTLRGPGARGDTVEIQAMFLARDAEKVGVQVRVGNVGRGRRRPRLGEDLVRDGPPVPFS